LLIFLSSAIFAQKNKIDSVIRVLPFQKDDTNKVKTLINLSFFYNGNNPDSSLLYAHKAITLAEQLNYEYGILRAQLPLTSSLTFMGNYPLAIDIGLKTVALAKRKGLPLDNILAMSNLVICYHYLGDFNTELKYSQASVKMVKESFPDSLAFIYTGFAMAYGDLNLYDSALLYAKKSYQQLKEWEIENYFSSIYPQLGNAFAGKKEYDSAILYFHKGIEVSAMNNYFPDEIDCYNGIASVYKVSNKPDSALWYGTKTLTHKFSKFYRDGVFKAATLLASVYESKGKPDSALKYLKLAIEIKDSLFTRQKTIAIQNLELSERQKQQDLEKSKRVYQDRMKLWALLGSLFILSSVAVLQWRNNNQRKKAFELLQKQERETDFQKQKAEQSLYELKTTQSQLIQSEKMASLGEMTAGIAHEIQNPLNFVNNFAEINRELIAEVNVQKLKAKTGEGNAELENELMNDIEQNLEKISHHGKRADAIVKSMLQHSRTSIGQKEASDINALTDEYLRMAYHGFRRKDKDFNVMLETDFDSSISKIDIIPQDFARVLMNLYNNAFYAVAEKIKKSNDHFEPKVITRTRKNGNTAEISVEDNGTGIPDKIKEKIFQPFFTTKPTGEGTGLGLSISHDIIKAHNGNMSVRSAEGEGTEIMITLPA
jgi:two-component system NtrC family sensor kinase